jgi:protein TonB
MTPKDIMEAASPAAKTSAPAPIPSSVAPPKSADPGRLRADAVSLDVPVRVHGSRVTDVVRGVTPHTEPFEEETSTMIVFPQGGVVRMNTGVSVGQMLVLTNQKTKQDAICRVVKVRANSPTQSYVEVEFTHRQAGYWGVHFSADDEDASALNLSGAEPPVVTSVSLKVEPLAKPSAPAPRNAPANPSAFASIGTKEEVQPAASSTDLKRASAHPPVSQIAPPAAPPVRASAPVVHVAPPAPARVAPPPAHVAPSPEPVEEESFSAVLGQVEAQVKEHANDQVEEVEDTRPARTFGTFTGGASASAQTTRPTDLGARLGADSSVAAQAAAPRNNSWMWIAACAFFLVAGLAGGAFYFRQHPASSAVNSAQPVQQTAPAAETTQSSANANNFAAAPPSSPAPLEAAPDRTSRPITQSAAPAVVQESAISQPRGASQPAVREAQPAAAPAPSQNFAISKATPVARNNSRNVVDAAPTVDGGPAISTAVPDVLSAPSASAPPPPVPAVRVGGLIVQPKLLRAVQPIYPSSARQAGISGNVVISAQVDKAGNVGQTKVVSGPATLQAAALAAMKNWKYSPGTLDGSPVDTTVTVTIHFQQQ